MARQKQTKSPSPLAPPSSPAISDAAVFKATGKGWVHWFRVLDGYGLELDHTARALRFSRDHPDVSGWWCQSITVEFEKARGLRQHGESSAGGYQVSVSRTLPVDGDEAWHLLTTRPFLPGARWKEGARWAASQPGEAKGEGAGVGGGRGASASPAEVEVRRVDKGRMLRFFWHDGDGKSTVEVDFQAKGDRTALRFRHHGLPSEAARQRARERWEKALDEIAS